MDSTGLLIAFRSEMADKVEPYLWDDEDVFAYADDAQKAFCRKTDGIADSTTAAVVNLAVVPGTDWLALHPSILRVRTAARADTGRDLDIINREDMPLRRWFFDGVQNSIKALVVGMEAHKVRVYPKSNETVEVNLTVFRLPLVAINTDGDQALEVDEEHHPYLLLWMKHRAYMKQDAETFDRTKADEFERRFNTYCEQVKREERRKGFKVRSVAYGGI